MDKKWCVPVIVNKIVRMYDYIEVEAETKEEARTKAEQMARDELNTEVMNDISATGGEWIDWENAEADEPEEVEDDE